MHVSAATIVLDVTFFDANTDLFILLFNCLPFFSVEFLSRGAIPSLATPVDCLLRVRETLYCFDARTSEPRWSNGSKPIWGWHFSVP